MPVEQGDGFNLDDRDRLPWLEPAEDFGAAERVPAQKVIALVLLGLALIGLIVGGGWWLMSRSQGLRDGEVALIPAPGGPYKIKAPDPKAKDFEGNGDESYAASEGAETMGRIDASKAPEEPMTDADQQPAPAPRPAPVKPAPKPAAKAGEAVAKIKEEGSHGAKAPVPATASPMPASVTAASTSGGARVQLGAYNGAAVAEAAWKRLVQRFEDLGTASHTVEPVTTGGKTFYRLRMGAAGGAEAASLCNKLRVAGERCWVVP